MDDKVLEYMFEKHQTLRNNYSSKYGENPENCSRIAIHIAGLLLAEGKVSNIIRFSKEEGMIHPVVFSGKFEWGYHDVCLFREDVYDPILSRPEKLESYCEKVFGEIVPFRVMFDEFSLGAAILRSLKR